MPVFYSDRVTYKGEKGEDTFPFFLAREDLDRAYDELADVRCPLAVFTNTSSKSLQRSYVFTLEPL